MISDLNRRQVNKGLGAIALSTLMPSATFANSSKGKIVVVGAGFAGIGTARHLRANGFDVEVIEAQDRIGGRVHSVPAADGFIDLGAAWLHGSPNNPLFPVAKEMAFPNVATDLTAGLITDTRQGGAPRQEQLQAGTVFSEMESALLWPGLRWYATAPFGFHAPKGDVATALAPVFSSKSPIQACATKGLLEVAFATELPDTHIVQLFGARGTDPFGEVLNPVDIPPSSEDALMIGGMQNFLAKLARNIDITLNEKVDAIDWSGATPTVQTDKRTIDCDAVIVTVSVGVLKKNKIKFTPSLTEGHRTALNGWGMALLNKVILEYPDTIAISAKDQLLHFCGNGPVQFALNGPVIWGAPIFVGLSGGKQSKAIETASDDDLALGLHKDLEAALGQSLPDPVNSWITRWASNPWAEGSYSFFNLNATGQEVLAMRAPLGKSILFAGEALSATQTATVHGAFFDGMRAADQLVRGL